MFRALPKFVTSTVLSPANCSDVPSENALLWHADTVSENVDSDGSDFIDFSGRSASTWRGVPKSPMLSGRPVDISATEGLGENS